MERIELNQPKLEKLKNDVEVVVDRTKKPKPVKDGFLLNAIKIEGAEAFPEEVYKKIYKDYIGEKIDANILFYITNEINELYRKRGYFLSKAYLPEQEVEDGIFTIKVVEGNISEVKFEKDNKPYKFNRDYLNIIEGFKQKILDMRPLNALELESIMLKINSLPGINARSIISNLEGVNATSSVSLTIQISDDQPQGDLSVDNFGSRFTGPWQTSVGYNFSPKIFSFDEINLNLLTSIPADEINLISLNYSSAISSSATRLGFLVNNSNTAPGYNLKANDIKSNSVKYGFFVSQPIKDSRERSLSLKFSLDFKDINSDILNAQLYKDKIRVASLGLEFESQDKFGGINTGSISVNQGLDIFGARETGSRNLSRAEGHSDFTKFEYNQNRLQQLSADFQLYTALSGQYAWQPLLSSEEFGYGGANYGRAYDPSEIIGDSGASGLIEVRYNSLDILKHVYNQPFIFYDIGKVWNNDRGTNEDKTASSAGLGVKLWHKSGIAGSLGMAFPIIKEIETPISGNGKNPRVFISFSYKF